jgi:hypothetical protein
MNRRRQLAGSLTAAKVKLVFRARRGEAVVFGGPVEFGRCPWGSVRSGRP